MALLWRGYCAVLQKHPFKVKAATSGCTFAATDGIAQSLDDKPYDWTATARNASFGVLYLGPANHVFWGRTVGLERWFPGTSWPNVFKRVLVDQTTMMPVNMALFLAWPALWARDLNKAKEDVAGSFVDSVSFALCVWPVVHPFSFRYVPLEHRLLVLNACSLVTFSFATFLKGQQCETDDVCDLQRTKTIVAAATVGKVASHSPVRRSSLSPLLCVTQSSSWIFSWEGRAQVLETLWSFIAFRRVCAAASARE